MTPLDVLATHLGERYSPLTRRAFHRQARQFLLSAGDKDTYCRADVLAFLDQLIRGGYRADSIAVMLAGVRALFDANDWIWPLKRRDSRLGLPEQEPYAPTLFSEDIRKLILGARQTSGFPRALVALSTTWGLRTRELSNVFKAGCDGQYLRVQTVKGGRLREHTIPPELQTVLNFPAVKVSPTHLQRTFAALMRTHVRESLPEEGWHAVRRSLVTGLFEQGLPAEVIHRWMGWRTSGGAHVIAARYFHPSPAQLDARVLDVHPFLAFWDH